MRERVTLQKRIDASDGAGNTLSTWQDVFTVAAQITPIATGAGMTESVLAGKLTGTGFFDIIIRNSSQVRDVTTEYALKNARSGQRFNIRQIRNDDEKQAYLTLACQVGVALG